MNIFALDSSGPYCSAAVTDENGVISESFLDVGLKHSETLMPLCDEVFQNAALTPADMDFFAVSCGPGSFTGLRIGIGTIKGMAFAADQPCVAVPTLEALAQGVLFSDAVIVPVMDARRGRVYSAAFLRQLDGRQQRVLSDGLRELQELAAELKRFSLPAIFVGDSAKMCYNELQNELLLLPTPPHLTALRASSVAAAAILQIEAGDTVSAESLAPFYMQLSQAERQARASKENPTDHDEQNGLS